MTYNTQRDQMSLPEYGRYVFEMVKYIKTLPTKAQRQRGAETVVNIMANMNPQLREQPDAIWLIWDHLAYISNYELDIDYPYPVTRLDDDTAKPEPLKYPTNDIQQRQYGHLIEASLEKLAEMPDGQERDTLLRMVANQMKQSLFNWNRDVMDNEKVANDIERYTDGKVMLNLATFRFNPVQIMPKQGENHNSKKKKV
ncbi:MAG: DUF4290 domain-containing protein [Prevotellaceae bacterium]|nr:DUF4290 domain-containing protein [Prevotellaceae bacterium]